MDVNQAEESTMDSMQANQHSTICLEIINKGHLKTKQNTALNIACNSINKLKDPGVFLNCKHESYFFDGSNTFKAASVRHKGHNLSSFIGLIGEVGSERGIWMI